MAGLEDEEEEEGVGFFYTHIVHNHIPSLSMNHHDYVCCFRHRTLTA